jgi:cell division protein FtsB
MANRPTNRPTERIEHVPTGFRIRSRYLILFFILVFFVLGGVYLSQQTKLESIASTKVELQTKLDSKKVEEERLERMLEYMQTTDYMIQYAREKLGYVFEGDWKFYDDTTTAVSTPKFADTPTPLPSLTTPSPKATAEPTPMPTSPPDIAVVTLAP